jgi:hypothetical protein
MLKVWAINPSRVRRGLAAVTALDVVLRETNVGTWTMTLDGDHDVSKMIGPGWRVSVYDDASFLFSGPLTTIRRVARKTTRILELEGVTDLAYLADRVAYPNTTWSPFSQSSFYAFTRTVGPAENHIRDLINFQAGTSMPVGSNNPSRTVPGLTTVTSLGRGASTTLSARWTNVLDEIRTLARVGGLVVDIGQAADSTNLVPAIRLSADLRQRVRFTNRNGLGDYEVTLRAPVHNYVIVGGGGTGTARQVRARPDPWVSPGEWGRRVETFIDRRDVPTGTGSIEELDKAADEKVAEGVSTATCSFDLTETARTRFGRDFQLGDRVTVQTPDGIVVQDRVSSARLTYGPHGRAVKLTLGENEAANEASPAWVKRVSDMERQMRRIQGAQ